MLLFAVVFFSNAQTQGFLIIHFLDVRQGDGAVIRTPYHQTVLIDSGPDRTLEQKLPRLLPFFDRTIDLAILTHPHADHITGLQYIFDHYQVKKVLLSEAADFPEDLISELTERKIPFEYISQGDEFTLGPDLNLEILAPLDSFSKSKDLNDSSIVAMLHFITQDILFTGDAGQEVEKELLKSGNQGHVTVLKTGHHGSRFSTGDALLNALTPDLAIISAGKNNSYGHPHKETLERLSKRNIDVLRTDQDGDIEIRTQGNSIELHTQHPHSFIHNFFTY